MRWVIGDIHGMARSLRGLLERIAKRDPSAKLYFVGDYVNRGPDSREVIDLLLSLNNASFVRGNHDDVLDLIVNGSCYCPHPDAHDPAVAFKWFMNHGLANTFTSYGLDYAELWQVERAPTHQGLAELASHIPLAHRRFIRELPVVIEEPDMFIAHAMWHANERDDAPSIEAKLPSDWHVRHRLLWGRFGAEIPAKKAWKRTGFFGHTPVETFPAKLRRNENVPVIGPNIVLVDTGAALSVRGRLSAVCVETHEVVQVGRAGEAIGK